MATQSTKGRLLQVPAGETLIHEDERSRKMYIIQSGNVRVYKTYMNQKITIAILGAGEIFGELSFFDAEPRTASVETLTETSVIMVDGSDVARQIAELPEWIIPIFKSVFYRFREADNKITVLQSMNEFQKRNFKQDTVAKTIYMEMLRFIKALEILCDRQMEAQGEVNSLLIQQEMDDLLGKRYIGLKVFWRLLKEYDFIDHNAEQKSNKVILRKDSIHSLKAFLENEIRTERFLLLGYPAIALLRKIIGFVHAEEDSSTGLTTLSSDSNLKITVSFQDVNLESMPLYTEALKEISSKKILTVLKSGFAVNPVELFHIFTYQSILKSFDHTLVNLG